MKPVRYHIGDIPETSKQTAPVMTTGQWVLTMIVFMIPLVNIVMFLFGRSAEATPTVPISVKHCSYLPCWFAYRFDFHIAYRWVCIGYALLMS